MLFFWPPPRIFWRGGLQNPRGGPKKFRASREKWPPPRKNLKPPLVVSTWIWCLWILVSISFLSGNCRVYISLLSGSYFDYDKSYFSMELSVYDMSFFSMNCFIYESAVCELLLLWVCYLLIVMSMGVLSMNFHVYKFNVCVLSCHEKYCLWFGNLWIVMCMIW